MSPFAVILGALALGKIASKFLRNHSLRVAQFCNRWVIWIALPALVFQKLVSMPHLNFSSPEIWIPVSLPWVHWVLSVLIMSSLGYFLKWNRSVLGAMILTIGLGNTSFVGFPLLRAVLGEDALSTGVILDQFGSFLILSTVAAPLAALLSPRSKKISHLKLLGRILGFPPFISVIFAFLFRTQIGVSLEEPFQKILEELAATLAPVALISVGISLSFRTLRKRHLRVPLLIGVVLKLGIIPLIYFFIYPWLAREAGGISSLVLQVTVLEGCMASMITAGVVAVDNGFEPELAQLVVSVTILGSLMTVPLWGKLILHSF